MITVTRLSGSRVTVNVLLIEMIEEIPDTVICMTTGNKIVVKEDVATVIAMVREYLRTIGIAGANVLSQDSEG